MEMADEVTREARDLLEAGRDFVIAKIVDTKGSTPRKSGAVMIMDDQGRFMGTIGGGRIEAVTQEHCRELFASKREKELYHYKLNTKDKDALDMGCGGDADVLIEYIDAAHPEKFKEDYKIKETAYIFGGGHVALALEPVLRHIGFKTVIIDDRKEFANRERYPQAEDVIVMESFDDPFKGIETDEDSYIVIVTRGHMGDYDVLRKALRQKCAYIGMIGSRKKNALLYDKLKNDDGYTQEDLDRVYAPIGTAIFAETPEEISISIAGELIMVRTGHGTRN